MVVEKKFRREASSSAECVAERWLTSHRDTTVTHKTPMATPLNFSDNSWVTVCSILCFSLWPTMIESVSTDRFRHLALPTGLIPALGADSAKGRVDGWTHTGEIYVKFRDRDGVDTRR